MPGLKLCTPIDVTPALARSEDSASVRALRALLVALCVHAVADIRRPQSLKPRLKMWYAGLPPSPGCRRITLMASRQHSSDPSTLVPTASTISSAGVSSRRPFPVTAPALLTHRCTVPSCSAAKSPSAATSWPLDTSQRMAYTAPWRLALSLRAAAAAANRFSSRPQITTRSPPSTSSWARANPKPRVAPVMTAPSGSFSFTDASGPSPEAAACVCTPLPLAARPCAS
mmetsp:Transcript_13852/g.41828  ORF Transcript_13852/g.41828 Transcript_13852/m.41828 type:complete len:228 (+) Transcript_13852:1153-1836(+)